jgi:hypothetical protein
MEKDVFYGFIPLFGMALGALGIVGWMFNNWLRVKHGYPLEDDDGKPVYRIEDAGKLEAIAAENARLKGALLRVEERVAVLERIATDPGTRVAREIEMLK